MNNNNTNRRPSAVDLESYLVTLRQQEPSGLRASMIQVVLDELDMLRFASTITDDGEMAS